MKTILNPADRSNILKRLRKLDPDLSSLRGQMSAPEMIAHLGDQMLLTLGELEAKPVYGLPRFPL